MNETEQIYQVIIKRTNGQIQNAHDNLLTFKEACIIASSLRDWQRHDFTIKDIRITRDHQRQRQQEADE